MPTNPAGLIYGTIAVAALLAAESARQETYTRTVAAVVLTLILYWLAHSYSQFTGERLEQYEGFSLRALLLSATHSLTVLIGATVPLVVLLGCWVFGASLNAGVIAAVWTSAGMIVVTEVVVGVRAELTRRELLAQTLFGALLGLLIIALRVLLH
ncbi:MAG: hypothetical protein ABI323_14515 [Solirubrobacteraceae bacterium]